MEGHASSRIQRCWRHCRQRRAGARMLALWPSLPQLKSLYLDEVALAAGAADGEYYSDEMLVRREQLRTAPVVMDALRAAWEHVAPIRLADAAGAGGSEAGLSYASYAAMIRRCYLLFKAQRREGYLDAAEFVDEIARDWEMDAGGKDALSAADFERCWFQLADLHVDSLDPHQYARFVNEGIAGITRGDGSWQEDVALLQLVRQRAASRMSAQAYADAVASWVAHFGMSDDDAARALEGTHTADVRRSRPPSREHSRPGSRPSSRDCSRPGSRSGSRPPSQPGSRPASRERSRVHSRRPSSTASDGRGGGGPFSLGHDEWDPAVDFHSYLRSTGPPPRVDRAVPSAPAASEEAIGATIRSTSLSAPTSPRRRHHSSEELVGSGQHARAARRVSRPWAAGEPIRAPLLTHAARPPATAAPSGSSTGGVRAERFEPALAPIPPSPAIMDGAFSPRWGGTPPEVTSEAASAPVGGPAGQASSSSVGSPDEIPVPVPVAAGALVRQRSTDDIDFERMLMGHSRRQQTVLETALRGRGLLEHRPLHEKSLPPLSDDEMQGRAASTSPLPVRGPMPRVDTTADSAEAHTPPTDATAESAGAHTLPMDVATAAPATSSKLLTGWYAPGIGCSMAVPMASATSVGTGSTSAAASEVVATASRPLAIAAVTAGAARSGAAEVPPSVVPAVVPSSSLVPSLVHQKTQQRIDQLLKVRSDAVKEALATPLATSPCLSPLEVAAPASYPPALTAASARDAMPRMTDPPLHVVQPLPFGPIVPNDAAPSERAPPPAIDVRLPIAPLPFGHNRLLRSPCAQMAQMATASASLDEVLPPRVPDAPSHQLSPPKAAPVAARPPRHSAAMAPRATVAAQFASGVLRSALRPVQCNPGSVIAAARPHRRSSPTPAKSPPTSPPDPPIRPNPSPPLDPPHASIVPIAATVAPVPVAPVSPAMLDGRIDARMPVGCQPGLDPMTASICTRPTTAAATTAEGAIAGGRVASAAPASTAGLHSAAEATPQRASTAAAASTAFMPPRFLTAPLHGSAPSSSCASATHRHPGIGHPGAEPSTHRRATSATPNMAMREPQASLFVPAGHGEPPSPPPPSPPASSRGTSSRMPGASEEGARAASAEVRRPASSPAGLAATRGGDRTRRQQVEGMGLYALARARVPTAPAGRAIDRALAQSFGTHRADQHPIRGTPLQAYTLQPLATSFDSAPFSKLPSPMPLSELSRPKLIDQLHATNAGPPPSVLSSLVGAFPSVPSRPSRVSAVSRGLGPR